jgi:hypothetical protein
MTKQQLEAEICKARILLVGMATYSDSWYIQAGLIAAMTRSWRGAQKLESVK